MIGVIRMVKDDKKEVDKRSSVFKREPNLTVTVTSGKFPVHLFQEWDKDCNETFGGCRWMKMWHDHQTTSNMDLFRKLFDRIDTLEAKMESIKGDEKKDKGEDGVPTLGGIAK